MSRRRYRFDEATKTMIEIGSDWTGAERRAQTPTEELTYGGARTTDGVDISTRKKHREHLQRNGLAMASDFTEHWKTKAAERARVASGDADTKERRETIGRALHEARRKGR